MKDLASLNLSRIRKGLLWSSVFLLLVGMLGLSAPYFLRGFLEKTLAEKLHRPVHIAELSINPYALSATVKGFRVEEKEGGGELFAFDELYVNLASSSLLRRAPVVEHLRLEAPRVHLLRTPDKRYNISDLMDEWLSAPDEGPSYYALHNIQVSAGYILFEDQPLKRRHEVSALALGIPFFSNLPSQVELFVEPLLAGKFNGSEFSLGGKARPFNETREASLDLVLEDLDLTPWLDYLPMQLPVKLTSARLDSKLSLVFSQHSGQTPKLTLAGELALRELSLKQADGRPVLDLPAARLKLKSLDSTGHVEVESLVLESPQLQLARLKNGSLSLAQLLPPSAAANQLSAATTSNSPLFRLKLSHFLLTGGKLVLSDEMAIRPLALTIGDIATELHHLSVVNGEMTDESNLALTLKALSLKALGDANPSFELPRLSLKGSLNGKLRRLVLSELSADQGNIQLVRESDGALNFSKFMPAGEGAPKEVGKPKTGQGNPPWTLTIQKLGMEGWQGRFEDIAQPVPLVLHDLHLKVENLSTAPGKDAARLALTADLGEKGRLSVSGQFQPWQPSATLNLDVKGLDLVPLQTYLGDRYNLALIRGRFEGKGEMELAFSEHAPLKARFNGSLGLSDVGLVDKGNAGDLLKWKSLSLSGINAVLGGKHPVDISAAEIALRDFFARLVINADGSLALRKLIKENSPAVSKKEEEGSQTAAPSDPESLPYRIKVGQLVLEKGQVRFSDYFIKPNYSANLLGLGGSISGLSSVSGTTANVNLGGTVDGSAPLVISGRVNPLAKEIFLDLTADTRGVEMSGFSPYSARYTGYGIEKGKLSANIHYFIENRQLQAENHIFLDQLTFGDPVENEEATRLPVQLAVALLKNSRGEIDINLPISGSLDDPQFSVGSIVVKMFVNLIVKAVTSPFALIGSLFGGGEQLAWLEFESGRSAIASPGVEKLQKLASALKDRPSLKLDVIGRADRSTDEEGYKKAVLERKLKAQKLKETTSKGENSASIEEISLSKEEWAKYLPLVYKAERFKKPRNFIGLTKTLAPAEMEALILENLQLDSEALRNLAEQRAQSVSGWLTRSGGIASERIFVVTSKLGPEKDEKQSAEAAKASLARVDFVLR